MKRSSSAKIKDRFRDWNLLHKSVVTFIVAMIVGVAYRAVIVIDAGFELTDEIELPYSTETVWPWITDIQNRSRWQGGLTDLSQLNGQPEQPLSTRLLFWRSGFDRWQAVEQTTEVVQHRLYATIQESDKDQRWFRVELVPGGPCKTKVIVKETIRPMLYEDRFWFFTEQEGAQKRMSVSLKALERWLSKTSPDCAAP